MIPVQGSHLTFGGITIGGASLRMKAREKFAKAYDSKTSLLKMMNNDDYEDWRSISSRSELSRKSLAI